VAISIESETVTAVGSLPGEEHAAKLRLTESAQRPVLRVNEPNKADWCSVAKAHKS
jgi:hypothetical protein